MSEFGWTRLAYLSVILTVLAILVKLGTFGASSLPEDFPEAALTFAQRDSASEEDLDWGSRPKERDDRAHEHSEATATSPSHDEDHDHSHEPVESLYENVNFEEDPPVFYRPAPRVSGASAGPSPEGKSCETVGDAPPGSEILFPMTREFFDSYDDTWGAARPQGGHEGTDLMAPTGEPLLAMTDGRIVPVSGANENGWNTLGGYTVMLEAAYSVGPVKKGDLFYYAHMDEKSDLRIGDTVEAGDVVGYAGDTGQGPEVSRGQFPPHLHLGWYETSGERTQLASGAMNPYPLLEWVKANGGSIEGGSDIPYCEAPQSSVPTPSDGGYWQFPSDPSVRPDIATGGGTAAPSPVVEPGDSAESSPRVTREPRRKADPPRPERPAPPEADDPPREKTEPEPPSNGRPSIPNFPNPLPGIGNGIGEIIDGIFNPNPPREATEPPASAPPEDADAPEGPPPETTTPGDTDGTEGSPTESTTPEDTTPKDTVPEDTTPENTAPEETDECEPHEHAEEKESGGNPRGHGDGEECAEDTSVEDEESPPEEETTGPAASDAVEGQYEDERTETTSGP